MLIPSFSILIKAKLHQISKSLVENSCRVFKTSAKTCRDKILHHASSIKKFSSKTHRLFFSIRVDINNSLGLFSSVQMIISVSELESHCKFITILDLVKWRRMHYCRAESSNTKVRAHFDFWLENITFCSKNNHSELLLRLNRLTTYPTSEEILWSYLAFKNDLIQLAEWTPRQFIDFVALLVRLSTAKTANAERLLAVCRLPLRPQCSYI